MSDVVLAGLIGFSSLYLVVCRAPSAHYVSSGYLVYFFMFIFIFSLYVSFLLTHVPDFLDQFSGQVHLAAATETPWGSSKRPPQEGPDNIYYHFAVL